jgi:hypothetical protein
MTYKEFKGEFMNRLEEKAKTSSQIGKYKLYKDGSSSDKQIDAEFIRTTNIKYSNVESNVLIGDFIKITHKELPENFCRCEMKYLYESFEAEGWDAVWKIIEYNLDGAKSLNIKNLDEILSSYDAVKDRLIIRAINYTDNKYALKDNVYKRVGDIALVLYIFLSETKQLGLTTVKAPKVSVESWGKDIEEVMQTALVNSNLKSVPRMYTLAEAMNPKYETGAYMALGAKCKLQSGMNTSTFTTYPQLNGATSFWYHGVQEKIAEMAGGDYYVAFTGIHEFHVHPVSTDSARDILKRVKEMNKFNKKDEILTRKVYLYHADTKELEQLEL